MNDWEKEVFEALLTEDLTDFQAIREVEEAIEKANEDFKKERNMEGKQQC